VTPRTPEPMRALTARPATCRRRSCVPCEGIWRALRKREAPFVVACS
jgi:hypothetical protein